MTSKKNNTILFLIIVFLTALETYLNGWTYISATGDFVRIWKEILNLLAFVVFRVH